MNDGDGYLTGGSNPNQMQVALNNSNLAGVTGTEASGAATATSGFEIVVPYADVDLSPGDIGPIGITALLMQGNGNVSNQWLPGLGGGYSNLGQTPDMTRIPGEQYALVSLYPLGDLNCDGVLDNFDIDAFVLALTDPPGYSAAYPACNSLLADCNRDGSASNFDIDVFIDLLAG